MSDACCTKGTPIRGDYCGKGVVKQVGDFRVYEVGSGSKTVLVAYDIFGIDVNTTRHFCDRVAEGSDCRVLMPDYFRGNPFPTENFPPADRQVLYDFVNKVGNWQIVQEVTEATLKHYNVQNFSIIGFCWGGKQVVRYAADPRCRAGICVHGSLLEASDAENIRVPVFFANAGDDGPIDPLKNILDKKPFGSQCLYKVYSTMSHGWCAGRGDWNKPDIREAAFEVIDLTKQFIAKHH